MSDQTFVLIRNYYSRTIDVEDADGNGFTLPLRVRRFSIDELQEYGLARSAANEKPHERLIYRKSDGDEQEYRDVVVGAQRWPVPIVSDEEVRRRRLADMTPEQFERFKTLEKESERTIAAFHRATIRDHLWLPKHVRVRFELEEGEPFELRTGRDNGSGEDLVKAFGGNLATLKALGNLVFEENTMSAEAKKKSRLLSDSRTSSPASIPTADGAAPDATAESAAPTASARSGGATDPSATTPSGSTGT